MDLQRFSKEEVEQMFLLVIKRYPEGISLIELGEKIGIDSKYIPKYIKDIKEIIIIDHLNVKMVFPKKNDKKRINGSSNT